jgi:cell division protein ZapA (FtsZ GTPase activity inhibitor)
MFQADKAGPDAFGDAFHALFQHYDATPSREAGGLSPHQLNTLIYCGWWAKPFPITLNSNLPVSRVGGAAFFQNIRTFLGKIARADGLEATVQGNLSRQAVAQLIEIITIPADYMTSLRSVSRVINERDVFPLHAIRILCELAGLVRRQKKAFGLSRKAKQFLTEERAGELYRHLFDVFFHNFNLAHLSRLPDLPGVQATFPFMLYKLSTIPQEQVHTVESLAPVLLLPGVQEEIRKKRSPGHLAERLLESRVLRPLEEFGLLEMTRVDPKDREPWLVAVQKKPLFDEFIQVSLP